MKAKPIIDINAALDNPEDVEDLIPKLQEMGYEMMPERVFADRHFLPKGSRDCRTHHLNLVSIDSQTGWRAPLIFRDYLRANLKARDEYSRLKVKLATRHSEDREAYTKAKSKFMSGILKTASEV